MNHREARFREITPHIKKYIKESKYVIIKLGTNLLTPIIEDKENIFFENLIKNIAQIISQGKNVLIVSSGAIGFGRLVLKNKTKIKKMLHLEKYAHLVQKQAMASLGQSSLINMYKKKFDQFNICTAQILVSALDFKTKEHYKNLKKCIDQLCEWGIVPIINENDAVSTEELKVGDNDTLAAFTASMYSNSFLILLTTVDGFYMNQKKIPLIEQINSSEMKHAGKPLLGGIGGMKTKLEVAKKIMRSGQLMNISNGNAPNILYEIMNAQETGTWFFQESLNKSLGSKKRWLLHNFHSAGKLKIDEGAKEALLNSGSLLGVGIKKIEGDFLKNDIVLIEDQDSNIFAKGIVSLNSKSLKDKKQGVEVIHQDNLVIL